MKNRKFKYLLPFILLVLPVSCSDWLSIEPKSEIDAEILFRTPEGFSIAMNGIYTNLSSSQLYGKELKNGFIEVLAHMYSLNNPTYEVLETYDYTNEAVKGMIESIWSVSYNTIANCNSIIEKVKQKDSTFFPESGKRMIEGEALAVRAMLYFDLLRIFAPAPSVADQASIPYYDKLSNKPMPYLKSSLIISNIISDLQKSRDLQRAYDTSEEAKSNFASDYRFRYTKGFYNNSRRGYRMGYYAATALLAEVALYAGNNALALSCAKEFTDDQTFMDFTPSDKIESGGYDRLLSEDLIFVLYNQEFEENFDESNQLVANVESIFGNDGDDFRKKCYLTTMGDKVQLSKLVLTDDNKREGYISYSIPMLRLSQMYHIAIETMFDTDPQQAMQLFNTLRLKRGCKTALPSVNSKNDLLQLLINDSRREFMGEGQMFFMYKRLNSPVLDENRGNKTLTGEFVIPVPDREISITN
jgi:hypothetical protein